MSESSLRVIEVSSDQRDLWERFTTETPGAEAGHAWAFHDLLARVFGQKIYRLAALRGSTWVGVLPLISQNSVLGRFLTSVPYLNCAGVLAAEPGARTALAGAADELATRLRANRLEIRGRDGSDLPLDLWTGKCGYLLDLPHEPDELWKALRSKVRAQVKRPRKEGYEGRVPGEDGRSLFYPVFARRWHQLGSPVLPEKFFAELEQVFGEDFTYVVVEREGEVAAAGALLQVGGTVEIPWAASDIAHNRFGVNMLLYWTALEHSVSSGAKRFDFGRSTAGTGNAKFKLQWGANELPLVWNVRLKDERGKAGERGDKRRDLMAATWRKLPGFVVGLLGPRLAARIPY